MMCNKIFNWEKQKKQNTVKEFMKFSSQNDNTLMKETITNDIWESLV